MNKAKPLLIFAGKVLLVLAIYKLVVQPNLPASIASKLPAV